MSNNNPILKVSDIHTYIGQFHILEGVNVDVPQGAITVLLGRNGAGKTTTLKSIMGMTPITQGSITVGDQSLHTLRPYEISKLGIGFVPEHRAIFSTLSVRENLEIAERNKGDFDKHIDMIFELFPDLKRLFHLGGGQLSGGQQQMLAVARALIPDNQLLLIDEPSEGLAPVIIEQLMEAIRQLSANTTILLVEQNFLMASQLADTYVIIEEGQSVKAGAMKDLAGNPDLVKKYLGVA